MQLTSGVLETVYGLADAQSLLLHQTKFVRVCAFGMPLNGVSKTKEKPSVNVP